MARDLDTRLTGLESEQHGRSTCGCNSGCAAGGHRVVTDGGQDSEVDGDAKGGSEDSDEGVSDAEIEGYVNQLDRLARKMLRLLAEYDGLLTASEFKQLLGHDHSSMIHYRRKEYLEPMGLVSTETPSGSPGDWPSVRFSLTDRGERVVELLDEGDGDGGSGVGEFGARIEELESELADLHNRVNEMDTGGGGASAGGDIDREVLASVEDRLVELDEELTELRNRVARIEDDPLFDEGFRDQFDRTLVTTAVVKELVFPKHDDDEIQEALQEKRTSLEYLEGGPSP